MIHALVPLLLLGLPSSEEFLDGAEIGDATHSVYFQSHGKYSAEHVDKSAGNSELKGSWSMNGDVVEAKPKSCKGPACKSLEKPYKARVTVVADRAMVVKSEPDDAMLETGSYYCHYQGCEKRVGVELVSKSAKAVAVNYACDHLIDKNRARNSTVVWWGERMPDAIAKSRIEYCTREPERAKAGAAQVSADLAELPWIGKLEPTASGVKDCLWDVRVYIADDAAPPAREH